LPADPGRPELLSMGAELEQDAMIVADSQHRDREALEHTERCANYLDRLFDGGRATPAQVKSNIATLANVALSLTNQHHLDEAIVSAQRMVALARASGTTADLGQGLSLLANALRLSGDVDVALSPITEARRLAESISSPNPMTKELALYGVLLRQGQILGADEGISLNRPDDAIEPLARAFDLMDHLAEQDPHDSTSRDRTATAGRELGDILRHHDPQRALAIYDRAIQREREQQASARTRREEARLLARSSYPLRSLGRSAEARARIDASFELLRSAGDFPAKAISPDREVAKSLRALADWQEGSGDDAGAMKTYGELLDGVLALRPDVEHDLRPASDLSGIYLAFARVLNHAGQTDRAAEIMSRRTGMWTAWDRRLPGNAFVLRQLHATTATLP
jgi:tetratricopeptide (TPR) repeat protein